MRPSFDEAFLSMAEVMALRGTCRRRQVGCVIIDHNAHVMSTGYNGSPSGAPHCIDTKFCDGMNYPSGMGLDSCRALHAEQNALMQCKDMHGIWKVITTTFPCITCFKLIANTSCSEIVYADRYQNHESEVLDYNQQLAVPIKFTRINRAIRLLYPATIVDTTAGGGAT